MGDMLLGLLPDRRIKTALNGSLQLCDGVRIALLLQGDSAKIIVCQSVGCACGHEREILLECDEAVGVILPMVQGYAKPQMGLRNPL